MSGNNDQTLPPRRKIEVPGGYDKVLLHSCCAPCSGEIMESLIEAGVQCTVFFYNPNIHPKEEYEQRKAENIAYAKHHGIEFIDADYDVDNWFERVKGYENDPERGHRCTLCFDQRFERSALYAHEHGFKVMTSSLGISRWKNLEQVNEAGRKATSRYPDLQYWTINWRKGGGTQRGLAIAKRENFYKQEYCGCVYSLRDMNLHRAKTGREKIRLGAHFYGEENQGHSDQAQKCGSENHAENKGENKKTDCSKC